MFDHVEFGEASFLNGFQVRPDVTPTADVAGL